ncbi:MAG: Glu/Leu/Phe/Val dehydrogenase dimerization domain-containing protein [Acidobacteriota bacterium]|jgi:leucine dehydrogenase|nr:Glu/Leu/Phe/Val dehydrogenase dimerization domain-containing protein [Acidobacteriota bacterium]
MDDREAIRGEEAPDEWQPVEGMRIVPAETLFEGGLASFPDYWEHEQVLYCEDEASGLKSYLSIHSTVLGPCLGGCRMFPYASDREALTDALRLSLAMSYKHAVVDIAHGGAKAVIIGDPRTDKTPELFRAFGRFVDALGGAYITGEDLGTSIEDVRIIGETTSHIAGLPLEDGGSGDPSSVTAYGVFCAIQASIAYTRGNPYNPKAGLPDIAVAVQGLGHVGWSVAEHLHAAGARLIVCDIDAAKVARAQEELGAEAVGVDEIYDVEADVFAPCALGGVLNADTVARLRTPIVAGSADNQLADERVPRMLQVMGILYAPDYVANGGGVINVSYEGEGYSVEKALQHTEHIGRTLIEIFHTAEREGMTTAAVADRMAGERLAPRH